MTCSNESVAVDELSATMSTFVVEDNQDDFTYEALPDPATHLRLIQVQNAPRDGDEIELVISTWSLKDVPKYHAVSYTWGDAASTEAIFISGSPGALRVAENCAHVLRQVFHFKTSSTGYYWVDAICICQEDDHEKSKQVAMMGDIFANAECVLACVGMHDESSLFLAEALRSYGSVLERFEASVLSVFARGGDREEASDEDGEGSDTSEQKNRCVSASAAWFKVMPDKAAHQFMKSLDEFPQRSYFWRIWILQELYEAREIRIFCGFDELSLPALLFWWTQSKLWFPKLLSEKLPKEYMEQAPWTDGLYLLDEGGSGLGFSYEDILLNKISPQPRQKLKLYEEKIVELCELRHCYDPRDIIYGTLRLIDWDGIQPDYTKSTIELAMESIAALDNPRHFLQLLGRLHMSLKDPTVSSRIALRCALPEVPEDVGEENIPDFPDGIMFAAGGFQIPRDSSWEVSEVFINDATDYCVTSPSGSLTAITIVPVREDDWLVCTAANFGVVLRRLDRFYRIVGSVVFVDKAELPDELEGFLMFFDPEDLVLHFMQDLNLTGDAEQSRDDSTIFREALRVPVCKRPLSSLAFAPAEGCSFPRTAYSDNGPDIILPALAVSYSTAELERYEKAQIGDKSEKATKIVENPAES